MDWNRTKTVFILIFFILDIFLFSQFLKLNSEKLEVAKETSIEDSLREEEITYPELPKRTLAEKNISGKPKEFKKEEIAAISSQTNQTISIAQKNNLVSELKVPIKMGSEIKRELVDSFIKENVFAGEQYEFWGFDEAERSIIYYQTYNDKMFFKHTSGQLTFKLSSTNEIESYQQTYLADLDEFSENQEIIPALKAIENLYNKGKLPSKSKIKNIELGYFTLVHTTSSQVLTPVWHVKVNNEDYFVKAFDGDVIELTDEEKLTE